MNQQVQNILAQATTKTAKIKALILLGLSRTEIAALVTNGNYGFVQNVYAAMKANNELNVVSLLNFQPLPFNRRFGVEFEAYNVTKEKLAHKMSLLGINVLVEHYNHSTRNHWKIIDDSSLAGANSFEVVSPVLEGENGLEQVKKVCQALKECNAYVNKSCGMHIHFDAQNFDLTQWKNIYKNYAGFENEIDSIMPQSRRADNNRFCKSLKNIVNLQSKIDAATSLRQISNFFGSRYFKINPESYARHNTIEFRQHSGTIEFEKVSNWIQFLHNLVDFSKANIATDFTFEGLKKFNQDEIITFYNNRKSELA